MANQANLVCPACLAFLVAHHWRSVRNSHHLRATRVRRDHQDLQGHPEKRAHLVRKDHPATPERTVATDLPAQLDHPAPAVNLARTEKGDPPEPRLSAFHLLPANQDPVVRTVLPDHQARAARPAQTALPEERVTKDHRDHLDRPVTTVAPETRDHPVWTDPPERRVFARNIAPRTAVCSSKMEQGDKRRQSYTDEKLVRSLSIFALVLVILDEEILFNQRKKTSFSILPPLSISFGAF